MDSNPTTTTTATQQVVVEVPEDRIAEFHVFFGRFLAGPSRRRRSGRYGRPHRGRHGRRCAENRAATEQGEATEQQTTTTEV
jgi:hypothetical protein